MPLVRCEIVRWVDDQPQPGVVETWLTDADTRVWSFIDKAPIFTSDSIGAGDEFPRPGALRCRTIGGHSERVEIETIDADSVDGQFRFVVDAADVIDD